LRRPGPVEYEVYLIGVDADACESCGLCIGICSVDVFDLVADKPVPARPENCLGCRGCVDGCPVGAITLVEI